MDELEMRTISQMKNMISQESNLTLFGWTAGSTCLVAVKDFEVEGFFRLGTELKPGWEGSFVCVVHFFSYDRNFLALVNL